jgi:CheY-like chemotaxis protein
MLPGQYVRIAVEDNGTGMDDKTLKRIFDPFFTTKGVGKGTGLGLSVVHGIVDAHNGVITVESLLYKGTTFTVYLPVTGVGETRNVQNADKPLITGNKERILVVDDEPAVLNIARRYLEMLDYTVEEFTTPQAALEAFTRSPRSYHLIFTDFAMPGMSGVDFAQRVRSLREDIPIVLCTGFGGAVDEESVRAAGISLLVNKPYQKHTISEAIAKALREKGVRIN